MVANDRKRIEAIEEFAEKENIDNICKKIINIIKSYKVDLNDVNKSVREAIENVCSFAYPDKKNGKIWINIYITKDRMLEIEICDFGCGINNVKKSQKKVYSTKRSLGVGFTYMEMFSDEMAVKSIPGKGTIVSLKFAILY